MAETGKAEPSKQKRVYATVIHEDVQAATGHKPLNGYFWSLMNTVKGNVGTGVFAMGECYRNSGMVVGPIAMVLVCLICLHCQHILVHCSNILTDKEEEQVCPTYAEIVKYTYEDSQGCFVKVSKYMKAFTNTFLIMAQYGFCCVYLTFIANHFKEVMDLHGVVLNIRLWIFIAFLPALLTTYIGNLKFLAPLSLISNIFQWYGIVVIFYFTTQDLGPIKDRPAAITEEPERYAKALGTLLFTFASITFIMNIRVEMKNPKSFESNFGVLNMATVIINCLYFAVGFMAYWRFGNACQGSVFLNLPIDNTLAQVTKILLAVAILFTFTFHMYITIEVSYPLFVDRFGPFDKPLLVFYLFKTASAVIAYLVANITTNIGTFISLVGAITCSFMVMIIPATIDMATIQGKNSTFGWIKDIGIILIGVVGMVLGTTMSVMSIIDTYKHN